jgi:hypothetical protein
MPTSNAMSPAAELQALQRDFAACIREPERDDLPPGVAARRMQVYRELFFNNVEGLLSSNFPVIRTLYADTAWNALIAPKGTPKPITDKLSAALDKALDDEPTRKRLLDLGSDIPGKDRRGGPALATLVKSEIAKWTPVIKAAGPLN